MPIKDNGKKFSAANFLMHKAEKALGLLDRVLANDVDEELDLFSQTQKQDVESRLPSPSMLLPGEDPVGLNFTQSQALDFSKSKTSHQIAQPQLKEDAAQSQ